MDSDRRRVTPHRREHWAVEPAEEPEAVLDDLQTPEETRLEAKRLLWRDSAIILIGIVIALLVAQFLPRADLGLAADATDFATGAGVGPSRPPGSSPEPDATFGPIVDPSLKIDATRPPRPAATDRPAVTLPPTGTFEPGETDEPTPRPSKKPPPTAPPTPRPTPTPAPTPTPEITPIPPPSVSISCSVLALTVSCEATTSDIVGGSQRWSMDGDGALVDGGDGSNSIVWTYLDPGTHTVTLTVDGDDGSQASDSAEVTV